MQNFKKYLGEQISAREEQIINSIYNAMLFINGAIIAFLAYLIALY